MAGLSDKVAGKAREIKGKITHQKSDELEGKVQQARGELKDTVDGIVDSAGRLTDKLPKAMPECTASRAVTLGLLAIIAILVVVLVRSRSRHIPSGDHA